MMSSVLALKQSRQRFSTLVILIFILSTVASSVLAQDSQLILDVNIVDPASGAVETGQIIEYVIDFSCASIIGACGDLSIDFPLDTELELIEVVAPPGYIGSFSGTPPNIVVNIINNPVTNESFDDGEAAQVTVRARVGQDLDDGVIQTTVTGTIDNGAGVTDTENGATGDRPISTPEGGWGIEKEILVPGGDLGPALDGTATYQIEVCPTTTEGVARLTGVTFVDRFPVGATLLSYNVLNGTSPAPTIEDQLPPEDPGPPVVPAGDGVDDTIIWTVTPDDNPHTVGDGCISVVYSLEFSDAEFDIDDDITNTAFASASTLDTPFPDNVGICPTACIGESGNPGTIDDPEVTPSGDKSGPGTAIVSPGVFNGSSTFTLGWDLNNANVETSDLTITDIFPIADSDGLPIIEVTEITTATWADGYQATLQYTLSDSDPRTWVDIATVDGTATPTFTTADSDFPSFIRGIRYVFNNTPTPLPSGFGTAGDAILRFFVRDGMTSADYGDPALFRDYENCMSFSGTYNDETGTPTAIPLGEDCTNLRIGDDDTTGITNIQTSKSRDRSDVFPLENIQFTLTLEVTQEGSGALLNPAIEDILPFALQIISWDDVEFVNTDPGEEVLPYLRVDNVIVGGETRQRLLFYWDDTVKGGDTLTQPAPTLQNYSCDSPAVCPTISDPVFPTYDYTPDPDPSAPIVGNPLTIQPPDTGVKTINIRFTAQPRLDAIAGDDDGNLVPSVNTTTVVTDSAIVSCQTGTPNDETTLGRDVDNDGVLGEVLCETDSQFQIREAAQMASQKWIRDQAIVPTLGFVNSENLNQTSPSCPIFNYTPSSSPTAVQYTRYPCVAQGAAGGPFEYLLRVQNTGLVDTSEYILYDVLPHLNDNGVSEALVGDPRLTEFRVFMTGPIVPEDVPAGFTFEIEYNTDPTYNSCRPEMSDNSDESGWQGTCDNTWVTTVGDWSTVTSFRIRQTGGLIPPGDEMIFTVPMEIDGTPGEAETGEISWNTFAQRFTNFPSGRRLLTAEPRKVGIIVEEVYSVGNRVWIDDGFGGGIANSGDIDGAEIGVNGVTVQLFRNTGAGFTLHATDVTRSNNNTGEAGYYFFGNLPTGQYYVQIVGSNFDTGGPLEGYISSTGNQNANTNNNLDSVDTGIDQVGPANYIANGVRTNNFTLTRNSEASGETDVNDDNAGIDPDPPTNEGPLGRGENFEQDRDSDLTVDFGFFRPMSIGNRIWLDNGATASGTDLSQFNDGILNGTEAGIVGVTVELYGDFDGDGNEDATPRTDTTDAQGYYLFDGLAPGDYRVEIPTSNFSGGALNNLVSSYDAIAPADGDPDNDDHGIDVADPTAAPVVSPTITLSPLGEPAPGNLPDDDEAVTGLGSNGEVDENSDLTVDFGFIAIMSLGNRVWFDDGTDSTAPGGFNPTQFDDSIRNGDELGAPGILVNLYFAGDLSTPISSTTTNGQGYYLFDNLPTGSYVVEIPSSQFSLGIDGILGTVDDAPLAGYFSSTDVTTPVDDTADDNDHGLDVADLTTTPLRSPVIVLTASGETQVDDEAVTGTNGGTPPDIADNNSDLTVDFGLFRPMSIGNRVWLDTDRATGLLGDGIRQATEAGIGNVVVQLYTDDGTGGLGTLIAETTTTNTGIPAQDGYYLFDRFGNDQTAPDARRLGPGNYIVHIPASQFATSAVLDGLINSDGAAGSGIDSETDSIIDGGDENGVNATPGNTATYPVNAGVSSTVIQLRYDTEPTAAATEEQDFDPNRPANDNGQGVEDDNGDLTVDFGFYSALAIGNRVWFDGNRNGFIDASDDYPDATIGNPGIPGVTVFLYEDFDGNDIADGPAIATDITDSDGYYLFDQTGDQSILGGGSLLIPGGYMVGIDPTAGNNSVVLANFLSTITRADASGNPLITGEDAAVDNDDNGIDRRDVDPDPTIIYSESIALAHFDETEAEADADKETGIGDGRYGIRDNSSDLTVDFGYYIPMSIGNQVWFDENNNGLIDAGEEGINGVIVELFRDTGSGINPATDTPYRVTLTNSGGANGEGYYIFDDLPQGNYVVRLAPENFVPDDPITGIIEGALTDASGAPYSSSESGASPQDTYLLDNQTDNNDNGIDENLPQLNGIVSNIINLTYNDEPDGAADDVGDLDPDVGEGTFGELDRNADMTIDFGLYPPAMSLGNLVFKDFNNNRIFDGADVGVDGVIVNLFRDNNQDGIPDSGITNPIATTTTADGGWYIFDGLVAGFYLVQVDEDNFRTAGNGTLLNFYSSQDKDASNNPVPPTDNEDDFIENGIDNPFSLATNPNPQAQGVFSPTIELEPSGENINEVTEGGLGPDGDGEPNIQPSNSDLTVDFGFYQPMSIGNVVWFDTNEDGLFNGTEVGIAGVTVELYRDDGNGTFDGGDALVPVFDGTSYVNFDTTDSRGFYLFDNLTPGNYWVHIPLSNFATGNALFSHISTQPENVVNSAIAPAPSSDSNDNGTPNDATATTVGVTSELVTLGIPDPNGSGFLIPGNSEPTNELNKSNNPPTPSNTYDGPASIGRYGELDNNSDITIDFGFVLQDDASMSIGNRIWFDTNRNGLIDDAGDDNPTAPGNPGIDDVVVLLYRANTAGNPIGAPIARDITANGGYYLFDVLDTDAATAVGDGDGLGGPVTPGNYVVVVPNSNFTAGGALETYISTSTAIDNDGTLPPSTGVEAGYPAVQDDNNDNGTRNVTFGVISDLVTLVLQNERDDEDPTNKEPGVLDGVDASSNPIAFNNSDLTIDFGFYLPMSLGNFVWVDTNNNGLYDSATESAVDDGVTLTLYQSDGTTPVDDPTSPGNPYQVSTTDGFYLFEGLTPGDYIVKIDQSNFLPGGLLEGYLGSDNGGTFEDDTDTDLNDNGRDVDPTIDGIPSGIITLEFGDEPTTEATSGNPADGPNGRGNNGELDNNSNLTVDFGVYPSTYFSIGNRVWQDTGAGANTNNGIHDSDEAGIANVIVYLFRDENDGAGGGPDGVPDTTTPFQTTTTDANGYYLFDSLPAGNYIVSIAPQNFNTGGVLRGFSTTTQADPSDSTPNDDEDNVSDHVNTAPVANFGIFSATYTLESTPPEPDSETDPTPAGATQEPGVDPAGNPIPNTQSNLTVDFGFIRSMSLGNLVWFDIDNDGLFDSGTELGIGNVTVEIYLDDGNNTFDDTVDTLIATDVTDGNGFYLFNGLQPGNYFVHIPNDPNWTGAGSTPLAGYQSSGPDAAAGNRADNNDNGLGTGDTNPTPGVTSEMLTLAFGALPTGEGTLSNNPDDGPEFRGTSNPTDNNSDLTWDFGFYLTDPMSIGNIVWIDDGNTTGTANNGIRDGDELGIDGVIVELYADSDGDGSPDTITPLETTTTDNGGYYLFDGLPPGQYVVVISEDNFDGGVLDGYRSTVNGTPDNDDEDNGIDNPTPSNGGVSSGTIALIVGSEPSPSAATDDSEDVTGTGGNGETDENSNLTVDFGFVTAYDWGDAPDTYGTDNDPLTTVSPTVDSSDEVGPSHRIISNLYLGSSIDDENDGQPVPTGTSNNTNDPDGDGTDEDGMVPPIFVAGTTVTVDITVFNDTGDDATLIVWFDWDGNGVFDPSEGYTANVPDGTDGVIQVDVDVPIDAEDLTGGNTYARIRLTTDDITTSEPTGPKDSGEVEDYYVEIRDPGLLINKTDGLNSILAGEVNTYTIVIENSGDERTGVRFFDDIPLATDTNATGYDPETIEWVCEATNGASCIANEPAGTGSSGGPFDEDATSVVIDELIDLPRDGRITYTITARVNEDAGLIPPNNTDPIVNVAQLPNELPPLEEEDETFIIFDPPFGVKDGRVIDGNAIRWTMIWYNPGATQTGVVITDQLGAGQSFPDTAAEIDLQCSGSSGSCSIVGDDTVRWTGTMLTSTPNDDDDAVVISFTVIVEGDGRYTNSATLDYGIDTATASDRVTIEDGEEDESDDDDDDLADIGFTQVAPTLVKTVDTPFTLPGATVIWTIQSTNDTGQTINNVVITDNVPPSLTITDGSTSTGDLTISGQTVTVTLGSFAPGETITVTLTTDISSEVDIPFAINNPAIIRCDCTEERNAIATVISVLELPATGESPWWRLPLLLLVSGFGGIIAVGTITYGRRRKSGN